MYEGQRDVLTIASGEQYGQGRLQEASMFGRASLTHKGDRAIIILRKNKSIVCSMPIYLQDPIEEWIPDQMPNSMADSRVMKPIASELLGLSHQDTQRPIA